MCTEGGATISRCARCCQVILAKYMPNDVMDQGVIVVFYAYPGWGHSCQSGLPADLRGFLNL